MNFRPVAAAFVLLAGCVAPIDVGGNDAGVCGPANCAGCCDANRVCQTGALDVQCGTSGSACSACGGGSVCQAGACTGAGCVLPSSLDWAAVAVGDSAVQTIELKNPTATEATATIGTITNSAGFSSSDVGQTVKIPARGAQTVAISFAPTEAKAHLGRVIMRVSDSCPDQVISLSGTGVAAVLTWTPDALDCGYLTPGIERVLDLTFSNAAAKPVKLSGLVPTASDYRVVTPQPVAVPARGTSKVSVAMKPIAVGPRSATLDFTTDLLKQPTGSVPLRCYGGGPDIDAVPSMDLGTLGYFVGASGYVNGTLTIQNVGTAPTPADPRANLHLGAAGVGAVLWEVRAKAGVPNNTAIANELCVGGVVLGICTGVPVAGSYDKTTGLEAMGSKARLEVPVRLTPRTAGVKEWEVVVNSNDPDEPMFLVTVRANVIDVPPCDYEVLPPALNFGLVASGSTRELELKIRNKKQGAGEQCVLSGLALSATSHPSFSLVGGPVGSQLLAPGSSRTVTLRFAPTGATPSAITPVTGRLEFYISSPTQPQGVVPLTATLGASCLSIVPNRFDFGTIQKTCNSATRTFLLYDTCAAPLELTGSSLAQTTPELVAVNTAGLAPGTLINPGSSPATFSLKYQPVDEGLDTGSFILNVKQGADLVDYVIPLSGTGDNQGLNSDTLLLGGNLKADILLVIDNSCSMQDKQSSLGAGFPSFISYANSLGLDYQIAVTSTDMSVEGGRILGSPTLPKILKSSTMNLNALFSQKVQLGIGGSTNEELLAPATAAVTAPLVSTDNAGLVRPGATLGIVAVSDAEDQSPQTVSYYVNLLLNVKPPGQLTFSAIAPLQASSPTTGCSYDGVGGSARTVAAVTAMGGLVREICTPDFNQGLLDLGPSVFGSVFGASSFLLSNVPDLTGGRTIAVKVNGVTVAPMTMGGAIVWTYDATANRLIFAPSYVPGLGAAVTATYFVACIQ